jgi:hypothetical protein
LTLFDPFHPRNFHSGVTFGLFNEPARLSGRKESRYVILTDKDANINLDEIARQGAKRMLEQALPSLSRTTRNKIDENDW